MSDTYSIVLNKLYLNDSAISFWVAGEPVAQGNMRANQFGSLYDATKGLKKWRAAVKSAAKEAMVSSGFQTIDEACDLMVTFYVSRPKTVKRAFPTSKPDNDKLGRAIGDALTDAKVLKDDSRIVDTVLSKRYVSDEHPNPGAMVILQKHLEVAA